MKAFIVVIMFIFLLLFPTANYIDNRNLEQRYEIRRSYKDVFGEDYEEIDSDFEK